MDTKRLEEGTDLQLDFNKITAIGETGLQVLPVAVQDYMTKELILVAYANKEALDKTIETGKAVFWSTSRNELWEKGLTSGNSFFIKEIRVNCEQNSLLYVVEPEKGKICHTKNSSGDARNCYYRILDLKSGKLTNLDK